MKIMGLDLSINSTGVCIYDDGKSNLKGESKSATTKYYIIASNKSLTNSQKCFIDYIENNPKSPHKHLKTVLKYMIYQKAYSSSEASYEQKEGEKTSNIYQIIHRIGLIIKKEKPNLVVIEGIAYGSTNSKALADLSGLNHAVRFYLAAKGIEFLMVTPNSNKKHATGNGLAKKDMMIEAWFGCDDRLKCLSDELKLDDLADAYFLAHISLN